MHLKVTPFATNHLSLVDSEQLSQSECRICNSQIVVQLYTNGWEQGKFKMARTNKINPENCGYFRGHFPQFTISTVIVFIEREYDCIFEVDQQNVNEIYNLHLS